jgi:hypothetical protein
MGTLLFSEEALDFLSGAVYDPEAELSYEALSHSFIWSDELLWEAMVRYGGGCPFRELIGYRGSVVLGAPDSSLRPVWEQVARACPGWPGLRTERSSSTLAAELHLVCRRFCVEARRVEREWQREAPEV